MWSCRLREKTIKPAVCTIGMKCFAEVCSWPMEGNLHGLVSTDKSDSKEARKIKEKREDFAKFYLLSSHATRTKKMLEICRILFKVSTLQEFG